MLQCGSPRWHSRGRDGQSGLPIKPSTSMCGEEAPSLTAPHLLKLGEIMPVPKSNLNLEKCYMGSIQSSLFCIQEVKHSLIFASFHQSYLHWFHLLRVVVFTKTHVQQAVWYTETALGSRQAMVLIYSAILLIWSNPRDGNDRLLAPFNCLKCKLLVDAYQRARAGPV